MELLWSLALIVVVVLALNHMAGGRSSVVLRPVIGIASRLLSMAIGIGTSVIGSVLRIGTSNIKLPGKDKKLSERGDGPPPPRC